MWDVSKISSRTFFIRRYMFHRRVYLLWLVLICTVVQRIIYFNWSVRTSFRLLYVPVNFIFWIFWFRAICDKVILRSTSEACIWFPTVTFSMHIIIVLWIGIWFLFALILYMLLKVFSVGCDHPQWLQLDWSKFSLSIFFT